MLNKIIVLMVMIMPQFYFGYVGKTKEMGLSIIASGLALAFLNIDKIHKFKGAGFEAEMKKVVEEANMTIENLKESLDPLVWTVTTVLAYEDRFGSIGFEKKEEIVKKLELIMEKYKIENIEIEKSIRMFRGFHSRDLLYYFLFSLGKDENKEAGIIFKNYYESNYRDKPKKDDILKKLDIDEDKLNENQKNKLEEYLMYSVD